MQAALDQLFERCLAQALSCFDVAEPMPAPPAALPVTVIVPIYNGSQATKRCLAALFKHTQTTHTILLVDDASTDLQLAAELRAYAERYAHVCYLRRAQNLGYLANVNLAITDCTGDVVLLNSDTEVGPQWLERLQRAALSHSKIAAASPLSDNATLLTILSARLLQQFDTDHIQQALASCARAHFPQLPAIVGFCVYLKRAALDALGLFDPVFAPGYGEEDDFSQRARSQGWQLVAAPDVFVRHFGGASFGVSPSVRAMQQAHARTLAWRWPNYESDVRTWWRDWPLREQSERLRLRLMPKKPARPRILHVLHRLARVGGTENQVRDLVECLSKDAEHSIIALDPQPSVWADVSESLSKSGARLIQLNAGNVQANQRIAGLAADLSDPAIERSFARFVASGDYDLVHIHHLAGWNSLLIPSIAKALGVPVVMSLHCHYALCPDTQMAEPDGADGVQACHKPFAGAHQDCLSCINTRREQKFDAPTLPTLTFLSARYYFWQRLFHDVEVLISPSHYLKAKIAAAFPAAAAKITVLAHGVEISANHTQIGTTAKQSQPLKIGFLGGDGEAKGFKLVQRLALACSDLPVFFHAYGINLNRHFDAIANLQLHSAFAPEQRASVIAGFDLVLLPSVVAETFSLVLSEANALAVPVLASDLGALPERITPGLHGWCLAPDNFAAWGLKIQSLCAPEGKAALAQMRVALAAETVKSLSTQAKQYWALYADCISQRMTITNQSEHARHSADPASARLCAQIPARAQRLPIEMVQPRAQRGLPQILAIARDDWAASQYRVHQPLAALARTGLAAEPITWRARTQGLPSFDEIAALDPDCVVLMHAIDAQALELLQQLQVLRGKTKTKLIFVLDDLLTEQSQRSGAQLAHTRAALGLALGLCDRLIVTTRPLAERIAPIAPQAVQIHIIPNALSARNWPWMPVRSARAGTKLRVLWAGAGQHSEDLALLLPVLKATHARYQWVFFGDQPRGMDPQWQVEWHPPVPFAHYPVKLAQLVADIGVAPLLDTPFNTCKSALKALEYGALGMAMIASDLAPYANAPIRRVCNAQEWIVALAALENDAQRQLEAQTLNNWVKKHFLEEKIVQLWSNALLL